MHADTTAVTMQSNKIVLNATKDNEAVLDPSYGKNNDLSQYNTTQYNRRSHANHTKDTPGVPSSGDQRLCHQATQVTYYIRPPCQDWET